MNACLWVKDVNISLEDLLLFKIKENLLQVCTISFLSFSVLMNTSTRTRFKIEKEKKKISDSLVKADRKVKFIKHRIGGFYSKLRFICIVFERKADIYCN